VNCGRLHSALKE
jgi:hypothetical protein